MADSKVTALSEISVPTLDDLLYYVDDPAGTPASKKASLTRVLGLFNHANDFRLTLASGNPIYAPLPATPSSTDTSAETCTFAVAHGWESGTIVTPSATGGGLSTGTRYYLNKVSATVVSFHTTVADAIAGTSKVNLTGSITAEIQPSGISNTTLYWSPLLGNAISIYDGTRWRLYTSAELSIALGTLTSVRPYDVFIYDNAGTLTLELLIWTSDTVRATDLVRQDGVWCKTGALTRRYLGTIRTDSTTTTIDDAGGIASQVGGKRFVWNADNRRPFPVRVRDLTASWTLTSGTAIWRQANSAAGNKCEVVVGLPAEPLSAAVIVLCAGNFFGIGIDLDATAVAPYVSTVSQPTTTLFILSLHADVITHVPLGYHYIAWVEFEGGSSVAVTFYGNLDANRKSGMIGTVWC